MLLKNILLRAAAVAAFSFTAFFTPITQAQSAGQPYAVVNPSQPSDTPDKIEVLEFFAYSCPHCAALQPMVEKWVKTLPQNVVFRPVPIAFNASMVDLQKLYYALESLDRLDLHPEVFNAIHKQHERIYDAKAISDWVVGKGIDRAKFEAVFNSFGVKSKVMRANELSKNYNIEGTPSLAVGGQYVTSPSMTGDYASSIDEAQKLLDTITKK